MEVAMEDDAFFADLNRRISLLIMDDDEDDSVAHHPSSSSLHQAIPQAIIQHQLPQTCFYHVPQDCRREIRGTGVFIPRLSSQPMIRRENKQGGGGRKSPGSLYTARSPKEPVSSYNY